MKTFELSSKQKNGRRKFKTILHEIYPDSVVDEATGTGSEMNLNGITWIREFCEKQLSTIKGMSLRCEFLDDERTELCGHGETDIIDGEPIFEDAVVIGNFEDGYIEEITNDEGETITACIGVGTIDSSCYHNFCTKLDEDISNGIYPMGSVEIMRQPDKAGITYLGGYVDKGRIPTEFMYSGYALLGVAPADRQARLLELNEQKEETNTMTETEVRTIVEQTVSTYTNQASEINQCKAECETKVAELNQTIETIQSEKNELEASVEQIQAALEQVRAEYKALDEKYNALWEERQALEKALGEARAKERIGELNDALAEFTDEEREYAAEAIEAFKQNPTESEINTVVNQIWIGIGKKSSADAKAAAVIAEQNAAKDTIEDIFGAMEDATPEEDVDIFN